MTQRRMDKNIESIYPLSPTQQGLLFHTLYAPTSGVYFEQVSCIFKKGLNVDAFKKAWQRVVDRHAVLRTLFVWENQNKPLQVVRKQVVLPWIEEDWRHLNEEDQRTRMENLLSDERKPGFPLNKAPLMRCGL